MAEIQAWGANGHHWLTLIVTENSTNNANNTSSVSWELHLQGTSSTWRWSAMNTMHWAVNVNGSTWSGLLPSTYNGYSDVTVASDSLTVAHNTDGTKSIYIAFSMQDNSRNVTYTIGNISESNANSTMNLTTIPRYFSSTPTLTYKSRTETSITYKWSTSETCDSITWHGTGTASTTGVEGTSGTVTFSGLNADNPYQHYGTFRRKDSGLSLDSNKPTNSTDRYPYVNDVLNKPLVIGQQQKVFVYNPYGKSVTIYVKANDINGATLYTTQINGTETGLFTIPASDLYNLIPSDDTGNLVYYCEYSDIPPDIYSGTFIINGDEKPTFPTSSWSYVANLTALTNNNQIIIDNYSDVTITIDTPATSSYNASITGYSATWGTVSTLSPVSGSSPFTLQNGNGTSIVVLANDSRDLQSALGTSTLDITSKRVLYTKPVVDVSETHRLNGIDTLVTLNANGTMFKGKFGEDGVQNAIASVGYRVKGAGQPDSAYSQLYPISLNTCSFDSTTGRWTITDASIHEDGTSGGFPSGSSYNVKLEFYDAQGLLGFGTYVSTVDDGTLSRDVYKDINGNYHQGWNGLADSDYSMKIYGNLDVEGDYYQNGVPFQGGGGGGDTLPVGTILEFPSTDSSLVPNGWMLCDGRALSRTEYADLFAVIGTKYGAGNGTTTFNIPTKAGLVTVGYKSSDTDFDTIGETGGVKSVTLTAAQSGLPQHSHGMDSAGEHTHQYGANYPRRAADGSNHGTAYNEGYYTTSSAGAHTHGIWNQGPWDASEAHTNLQPYSVSNYIIKVTETTTITAQVLNEYANNTRDAYSCDYINNHFLNHPVGSLYISADPTSPASMFGGTWEQLNGYYLYLGNGYAKTSYTGKGTQGHTLTESQIPSHRHWISSADYDDGNMTTTGSNQQYYGLFADAGSYSADDVNKSAGRYSAYAGGGGSHSHNIATLEVYAWRRTA